MRRLALALLVLCIPVPSVTAQSLLSGYNYGSYSESWNMSDTLAANFLLPQDATLTGASIYTGYMGPGGVDPNNPTQGLLDHFGWTIYSDNGSGLPGAVVASGTAIPTASDVPHVPLVQEYTFALPNVMVSGNTRYWMSVLNETADGATPDARLYWSTIDSVPGELPSAGRGEDGPNGWTVLRPLGDPRSGIGDALSLNLFGTVTTTPEPSSLILLGTGLLGLVPVVRRKRRSK